MSSHRAKEIASVYAMLIYLRWNTCLYILLLVKNKISSAANGIRVHPQPTWYLLPAESENEESYANSEKVTLICGPQSLPCRTMLQCCFVYRSRTVKGPSLDPAGHQQSQQSNLEGPMPSLMYLQATLPYEGLLNQFVVG